MPGASHIIGNLSARHRAVDSATSSATSTARPSRAWRSTSSATTYSILTRLPGEMHHIPQYGSAAAHRDRAYRSNQADMCSSHSRRVTAT
jgi:hypothetical protein